MSAYFEEYTCDNRHLVSEEKQDVKRNIVSSAQSLDIWVVSLISTTLCTPPNIWQIWTLIWNRSAFLDVVHIFNKKKFLSTRAINNRGFYYFFILSHVGFSLMIGGIPLKLLKMCGYKTRAVITRERLLMARVRYL